MTVSLVCKTTSDEAQSRVFLLARNTCDSGNLVIFSLSRLQLVVDIVPVTLLLSKARNLSCLQKLLDSFIYCSPNLKLNSFLMHRCGSLGTSLISHSWFMLNFGLTDIQTTTYQGPFMLVKMSAYLC